jgi:hypothetical protein
VYRVWIIYFIDALEGPTGWTLAPYVTSEFSLHGLTAVTSVVAQLVAGLFRLPLAKVIDSNVIRIYRYPLTLM